MKQKDVALIIIVVFISGVISFVISGKVFSGQTGKQSVVHVDKISSDFNIPDNTYFNSKSIDPTLLIQIGNSTNPNPFNSNQ